MALSASPCCISFRASAKSEDAPGDACGDGADGTSASAGCCASPTEETTESNATQHAQRRTKNRVSISRIRAHQYWRVPRPSFRRAWRKEAGDFDLLLQCTPISFLTASRFSFAIA